MSVPPPHRRIIPHMEISEQGLRELEIWLLDRIKMLLGRGDIGILYNFLNVGPSAGSWIDIVTNSVDPTGARGFRLRVGVGIDDREGDADFEFGHDWNVTGGNDFNVVFGNDINMQPQNDWNLVALNDVNEIGQRDWNAAGYRQITIFHGTPGSPSTASSLIIGSRSTLHPRQTFTHTSSTIDLETAGNTHIVNDAAGNPIMTLTG